MNLFQKNPKTLFILVFIFFIISNYLRGLYKSYDSIISLISTFLIIIYFFAHKKSHDKIPDKKFGYFMLFVGIFVLFFTLNTIGGKYNIASLITGIISSLIAFTSAIILLRKK